MISVKRKKKMVVIRGDFSDFSLEGIIKMDKHMKLHLPSVIVLEQDVGELHIEGMIKSIVTISTPGSKLTEITVS